MQQIDGPLPIVGHVLFAELIGAPANIAPSHGHMDKKSIPQILLNLLKRLSPFLPRD